MDAARSDNAAASRPVPGGETPASAASPPAQSLSQLLRSLGSTGGTAVTLGDVTGLLSQRGPGALMVVLATPNLLPLPPGASTLAGIPLILVALHLIAGRNRLMLPDSIARWPFDRRLVARVAQRLGQVFEWTERFSRPRLWVLPVGAAQRLVGLLTLLMALIIILPIPLGNFFPAAAVVLLNLAWIARDGAWFWAGVVAAAISLAIAVGVVGAAAKLALTLL